MRIPCRALIKGRKSKESTRMGSHRTVTVTLVRASKRKSSVRRIPDTSTPSQRVGGAQPWRLGSLVGRAVVGTPLGSVRAAGTLSRLTSSSPRVWTCWKKTCSRTSAVPKTNGSAKSSAVTNGTWKNVLLSLTKSLTEPVNCGRHHEALAMRRSGSFSMF